VTFHRKGTNYKSLPGQCMVVGCLGPAIYVNVSSYQCRKTKRGYCSKHKNFARPHGQSFAESSENYYKWSDDHDQEDK
jgi:hypothetical protein